MRLFCSKSSLFGHLLPICASAGRGHWARQRWCPCSAFEGAHGAEGVTAAVVPLRHHRRAPACRSERTGVHTHTHTQVYTHTHTHTHTHTQGAQQQQAQFTQTASGLKMYDVVLGTGEEVEEESRVTLHYIGRLAGRQETAWPYYLNPRTLKPFRDSCRTLNTVHEINLTGKESPLKTHTQTSQCG